MGVKRASDGRYMPCTKKMVQESEIASKAFCLPQSIQIHDGDGAVSDWLGDESVSHVVQILRDGFRAARYIGMSLFVLDRYFLTKPMLMEWEACSAQAPGLLHVITRAKRNCTAYEKPGPYKGRGRRPVHGSSVYLQDLFVTHSQSFHRAQLHIYGA